MSIPKPTDSQRERLSRLIFKILDSERISLEALANKLKVTPQNLTRWRDRRSLATGKGRDRLVDYLNIKDKLLYQAYIDGAIPLSDFWGKCQISQLPLPLEAGNFVRPIAPAPQQLNLFEDVSPKKENATLGNGYPKLKYSQEICRARRISETGATYSVAGVDKSKLHSAIDGLPPEGLLVAQAMLDALERTYNNHPHLLIKSSGNSGSTKPQMNGMIDFSPIECDRLCNLILISANLEGLTMATFWRAKGLDQESYVLILSSNPMAPSSKVPESAMEELYPHLYQVDRFEGVRPILQQPLDKYRSLSSLINAVRENGATCNAHH